MASLNYILLFFMLASGSLYLREPASQESRETKVYIVRFNASHPRHLLGSITYMEVLNRVLDKGRNAPDALIYSFKESFTGFAARLTDQERKKLEGIQGILGVEPSRNYELHTTRSWDFLGFPVNVNRAPQDAESDLIIGVIDTGIWPSSPSFNDDGLGPRPARWKGVCQTINCNKKIIGARRYYSGGHQLLEPYTAMDTTGHGTHVASTAAGRIVQDASFYGLGQGIARGGVPRARIAVYKVCWTTNVGAECPEQDIYKAIDDAMSDGVDIIQASLAHQILRYTNDAMSVGSFRAMKKGILMVAAGGNDGPALSTIANGAPWVLTVAASTIDRKFVADLEIGNGQILTGENINGFSDQPGYYKLLKANNLRNGSSIANQDNVNVITDFTTQKVNDAINMNPRGVIASGDNCPYVSPSFPLPGVCLISSDRAKLDRYMVIAKKPIGKIYGGRGIQVSGAPVIPPFSSRGPNPTAKDILKPDISAPGFNILAAWPTNVKPSDYSPDPRSTQFNIKWGTSVACPHVSGIAVYIKSFRPTWSPAAIKSAIMTTATAMRPAANPEAEFAYGSGQLNPIQALSPGLVYDATDKDYVKFLCADGYSETDVRSISGDPTASCSSAYGFTTIDLNYPSMSAKVVPNSMFRITFHRTVTHVEPRGSVYTFEVIIHTPGVQFQGQVNPSTLSFSREGEKKDFTITVTGTGIAPNSGISATLIWKDGNHKVQSPIVTYATIP